MKIVEPIASTTLPTRAYAVRPWAGGWVIRSPHGEVTLIDRTARVTARRDAGTSLEDVAVDATGALLFEAGYQRLAAVELASGATRWELPGHFLACASAGLLWAVARRGEQLVCARHDPATGAPLRSIELPDPFGEAAVMLLPHPDPRHVVAWVAAGQDGQVAYLVGDDGAALTRAELAPRDALPVFSPAGDAYLAVGAGLLELRTAPAGELLDELAWSDEDEGEVDVMPGEDVQFLPGGYASWGADDGRIFLIDLAGMHVAGELSIAPDFEYAVPGPDGLILSVHARRQLFVSRLADWSAEPSRPLPGRS